VSPGEPLVRWDWVADHLPDIAERLGEHVVLAGIALAVGFVISLATGIYVARRPRAYGPVTWVAGILYTIPSLALFALLIPFTGLTLLTAEIGLVSYTLLILIRNVAAGIRAVPEEVRETALGMGYTPRQLLWRVELPLALAVIVAGLRLAAVTTIGLTTVTAIIGQGGLGALILDGLQLFFATPLLVGAVLSIALAVVVDAALVLAQRAVTPWARRQG
jgi:osmoprotectant transport system permease protein